MTPCAQNLVKNLKYHSGSSVSDYMKNNFVAFKLYTVAVVEWLRHTGNAELLFETRVHLPRLLLITLMSGDQLYFSKGDPFCFALFRSKDALIRNRLRTVQTWRFSVHAFDCSLTIAKR